MPVTFQYDDESDHGTYPIPANAPIEGGASSTGDRHVLVVDRDACKLYELFSAYHHTDGSWQAASGAIFDLTSDTLRPDGLDLSRRRGPPGTARARHLRRGCIRPRRSRHSHHGASEPDLPISGRLVTRPGPRRARTCHRWVCGCDSSPPLTQRVPSVGRPIVVALKTYGAIVADNGRGWFISGVPDSRWDNDALHTLGGIKGSDWQAVDESSLQVSAGSGQARAQ